MNVQSKKYKLAIIDSHIIQYYIPLYKKINAHPDIELTVFFCSDQGLKPKLDPGFGIKYKWDVINLEGLNYKFLKNFSPLPNPRYFWGLFNPGIINELKKNRYDAIIVKGYAFASYWLAFYAAYITKTPMILTGEPPTPWKSKIRILVTQTIKRMFMPYLLGMASAILFIGKKSKEFYLFYRKDIEYKLFFCPFSIDNEYYLQKAEEYRDKKVQLKEELSIPLDYPVILFLSKLIHRKQPMLLLKAFHGLKTPANLIFVGSGRRLKILKRYVKQHDLKHVYFFGFQNYSQVPKFYAISDIFVFPSLGESWGLVINEAMCFGLPIVTTDKVMSIYDLVYDGKNGYIIEAHNKGIFIKALEDLLNYPEKREMMGRISKQIIKQWNYDCWIAGLLGALQFIKNQY